MAAYTALSAVLFHEGPRFTSSALWGVPMTYVMADSGTPSAYPVVDRSMRSYPVLAGPFADPDLSGVNWYRLDILSEGYADIPEAWVPLSHATPGTLG